MATVGSLIGGDLFKFAADIGHSLLSADGLSGITHIEEVIAKDFSNISGKGITAELGTQTATVLSSLLVAELGEALGLEGFVGQAFTAGGSTITGQMLTNIGKFAAQGHDITTAATLSQAFEAINIVSSLASAGGSLIGSYLGSQLVSPDSIGETLFTSVGGAYAGIAGGAIGSAIAAGGAISGIAGVITSQIAGTVVGQLIGTTLGAIILPGVGALLGVVIGQVIGSAVFDLLDVLTWGNFSRVFDILFDEETPNYQDAIGLDHANNQFSISSYHDDVDSTEGMRNAVDSVTNAYLETVNGIIADIGGRIAISYSGGPLDATSATQESFTSARFAMHKDVLYVRLGGPLGYENDYTLEAAGGDVMKLVRAAVDYQLRHLVISGGDMVKNMALLNWQQQVAGAPIDGDSLSILLSNLQIASDYVNYLENTDAINTLIAAQPDSAFAVGWIATLLQAVALDMNKDMRVGYGAGYDSAPTVNADTISTADGNDVIFSAAGDDVIRTFGGKDTVTGDEGNDRIDLGSGNDDGWGGNGSDTILGGTGNDLITGGAGADSLDGGAGIDTVSYFASTSGVIINLNGAPGVGGDAQGDILANFEIVLGTTSNDSITGSGMDEKLYGYAGNDVIDGGAGDDLVVGDDLLVGGNDLLSGGDGNDTVQGEGGDDTIYGGNGNDLISGGTGHDSISAGAGNDTVYGSSDGSSVMGDAGDDFLLGGVSDDLLVGGDGADQLFGAQGNDTLDGGDGNDALGGEAGNDVIRAGEGIDTVYSGDGNDFIEAGHGTDFIKAGDGNDTIYGGDDTDPLHLVNTQAGDDTIYGEAGNDRIYGNSGNDSINAGAGNDTVDGGDGQDVIFAYEGNDSVDGGAGNDQLFGISGDDTLKGSAGNDALYGDAGKDKLYGGTGDDSVSGGTDNDTLDGSTGNDTIAGGAGDDVLTGGDGNDALYGDSVPNLNALPATDAQVLAMIPNLSDYQNWGLLYQGPTYTVEHLIASSHDMLIITPSQTSHTELPSSETLWTASEIAQVKDSGKVAIGYVDIAKINSFTQMWQAAWSSNGLANGTLTAAAPAWIQEFQTAGTRYADFANADWQNVVKARIGTMIDQGFDGTLLDDPLDYYSRVAQTDPNFVPLVNENARIMRDFILDIREYADAKIAARDGSVTDANRFKLIVNGAPYILNDALNGADNATVLADATSQQYLQAIDAILAENYFTKADPAFRYLFIDHTAQVFGASGVVMLSLDTEQVTQEQQIQLYTDAVNHGFLPYATSAQSYEELNRPFLEVLHDTVASSYNDTLSGGNGDDTLDGGIGDDLLTGGAGADSINGGDGNDTVSYAASTAAVTVNLVTNAVSGGDATGDTVASIEHVIGSGFNDRLTGNALANRLDGGAGNDTLIGGAGDDSYVVDSVGDVIVESANAGIDTVFSSITYALASTLENLALTGSAAINGTGNTANNAIIGNSGRNLLSGNAGDDTLDGGAGIDTLVGGTGNDVYGVDVSTDIITENANEGTDSVFSSASYVLAANLENLTLTGAAAANATGNALHNTLTGNSGNNVLNGGLGNDTLSGGLGNDTYMIDSGDTLIENANAGTDTVRSGITYTLGANLENLVLTGLSTINGTGNTLDNVLTGNFAANLLTGNAGNDTLDGSLGSDTMIGGSGNDSYVVDAIGDVVTESSSKGTDTVLSSITYTLGANVENLTLTGISTINGTGNTLHNTLTGNLGANLLVGDAGNDTLDGGAGNDTLRGGVGNDNYIVDAAGDVVIENANEGTDTVQSSVTYTLGANVENLILVGSAAIRGTGNALDNTLTGNAAGNLLTGNDGNDTLDGGAGNDTLRGGTGDDSYSVDAAGDVVTENANGGTDTVRSSVTYTLGVDLENLTLTGLSAINGTGNSGHNSLIGNAANNMLDGGTGNDTMSGAAGDDTYMVDAAGDMVIESAGAGNDTVISSVSYTLGNNVENLVLLTPPPLPPHIVGGLLIIPTPVILTATGNALNNMLTGNANDNVLGGGAGNDTLTGGAGIDTLVGGTGNDSYIVDTTSDVITENTSEGSDTVLSNVTYALGANLENLTLTGSAAINATGNTLKNLLTGNSANNTLDGGAGADTMVGGAGDDRYMVDNASDTIVENANEGTDSVFSSASYMLAANSENLTLTGSAALNASGNAGNNILTGNAANNTLNGGAGNDTMIGGAGDDSYVVDATGDVVTEVANEGTDTVTSSITYTLGANLEKLTLSGTAALSGTGNAGNNLLTGNRGSNLLDGGTGDDTMVGSLGDDTYTVDSNGDVVTELASQGTDTVRSSVAYTLSANVENLILTGTTAINGAGNSLNNVLTGNEAANVLSADAGNDTLDGGAGNDTLRGGAGNDTYMIDAVGDVIVETTNEGTDTVVSSVTYTLSANLENLTLAGTAALNGTGNSGNNLLTGNSASNVLSGGAGNDTLKGAAGDDTLVGGAGADAMDGGDGIDTASYAASTALVRINLTTGIHSGGDAEADTITNIENLIGSAYADSITGNAAANSILGGAGNDTLSGQDGNDTLDGGAGNDSLSGGNGDDLLIGSAGADTLDGGAGNDTASYAASAAAVTINLLANTNSGGDAASDTLRNIEHLIGSGLNDQLSGNTLANLLQGGAGNDLIGGGAGNDTLDGGAGNDTMNGGTGNDSYHVDAIGDVVNENASEGADTVLSSISYTLGANLENLTLTGTAAMNATGNSLKNVLTGNAGNNTLDGGDGNDTMRGGAGNDRYIVTASGDVVSENANEGTDTVLSSIAYTLGANLENLTLTGTAAINGTGNALHNLLTGNSAANRLVSGDGDDTLDGGTGNDTLIGGNGNDSYTIDAIGDVVSESANAGTDTVRSSVTYTLSANLENLTLTGNAAINGTGNAQGNLLVGNAASNTLDGGAGNDSMRGGAGDDIYMVDTAGDGVSENANEGTDTIISSVTYSLSENIEKLTLAGTAAINATGNALNNTLTGNTANNVLDGGTGSDTMSGGAGNDSYVVDTIGDIVIEDSKKGTDTMLSSIAYTLGANLENLTLTGPDAINGTGNSLNNVLIGNAASNTLTGGAGNDTLNGGYGDDSLIGGIGNDSYIIGLTDTIIENANEGTDTVFTIYAHTLGANLENLTLTGIMDVTGTGNALNNVITGNGSNNILDGGAGNDTLIGGAGDDTYYVDATSDVVTENATSGFDAVISSASYVLGTNVEALTLVGNAPINGTGNSGHNLLTGNAADNILKGGSGNDTLDGGLGNDGLYGGNGNDLLIGGLGQDLFIGGAGNDIFRITALLDSVTGRADTIDDFIQGQDKIDISALGYTALDNSATPATGHLGTYTSGGFTHLTDGHDFDLLIKGALTLTNADIIHA
ncbi:MAG: hypothetical protein V4735_08460 [Pseudomonadota bacterium]